MIETSDILLDKRGHALWITINRPHKRNSMTLAVIDGIREAIEQAPGDPDIRAIVLTGSGDKAFCAGMDLSGGAAAFGREFAEPTLPFANLLRAAHACRLPLVARVNGTCMAGGMGLLAMCDMAVAADHALFGLPEVKIGVFPMQVLAVLQSLLAPRDLAELCICGEPVDASAAERMRLVNYVAPAAEIDERTEWLLARIVDKSPTAIRRGKYALSAIAGMDFSQAVSFAESQIAVASMTQDAAEGVAAFNEKRRANWTGG